jgi:hypothetical protein
MCVLKLASVAEAISDTAIKLAWRQAQKNDGYRQPEMLHFALMENNHFRYHGYRNYISFIHGHLGKHRRLVIPVCVTKHLRHRFPDPKGEYTGFLPGRNGDVDEILCALHQH